ncbi:MAG: tRNA (cytidine(34)-2'-O)-methyltransferase [Micavibrio sp.]|nr:MAG: tRNA (cytidine(34)-2'-O)-methyltransferase [Micavibrio sp.]
MRLALYNPDIPQNTGAVMRLCSCFDVTLDIIEPCGFALSDSRMRRAGMDYLAHLKMERHKSWETFRDFSTQGKHRIVLMTTKSAVSYTDFDFAPDDIILAGRETSGVPDHVHDTADARVLIPMAAHARSLNMAQSCAIVLSEALRQTKTLPQMIASTASL